MSGHSKWKTIKNKKGKEDAKRGAIFTKLARYIMVAARDEGADPKYNASLKAAIDKAKAENMLMGTLKFLFALSENYLNFKANENFLEL